MEALLATFRTADFGAIVVYGLLINGAIYGCSLAVYSVLSRFPGSRKIGEQQAVVVADVLLSFVTVLCNTVVFILGVLLWQAGIIVLAATSHWLYVLAEVLFLTLIMDLLMYVFHRAVHLVRHFRQLHERHHEHVSTNLLSLFVLHPVESIGFGLMMLAVIVVIPFSAIGISLYLLLNSLWGTIGHLHHSVLPASWLHLARKARVCTSEFHYLHHQHPGYNFGFYFSFWDRLFKTLHPKSGKH